MAGQFIEKHTKAANATELLGIIRKAINDRMRLVIDYAPGLRTIEPHALGISADGSYLLRAYQTKGPSSSKEETGWKLFRLDKFNSLAVAEVDRFGISRPGYRKDDSAMPSGIIAQL